MSIAGRHVRGERDTSWSQRVKLRGRGNPASWGTGDAEGPWELHMGGGALKWEVYDWRAGLLRRVVSKDWRGSHGLESGDFRTDGPRERGKRGHVGQSEVF